jgi:alkanesulfonate monooxygenase SsuD/methylene tetrahydromethanopterin reductase-like flavin-dependent oxidoreductase (luciferase family)
VAPSTQTVMVNLPPEVVDKLSPHQSGLPQSWATIIAAFIAVVAALIALGGVWWQIRSAAREAANDRAAAAKEARNDRVADARLARHAQLVERMAEAVDLTRSLQDVLSQNRGNLRDWAETKRDAFNEQTQRLRALSSMLQLLGAKESGAKLHELTYKCNVLAQNREETWGKPTQLSAELSTVFEKELSADADVALPPRPEAE